MPGTPPGHAAIDEDADLSALRSFAGSLDGGATAPPEPAAATNLPGVDQMIDKLLQRLQREPGDVRGWKMLGWSYLNTGRAKEAAQAYETALKLAPADSEILAALETVRAAQAGPGGSETEKR
jgi:cytochrome c-type biogenesis protein CcmH